MTLFIRSLSIRGFRNLADVQLSLRPLNVLAGGNGKSALLQFFEMLSFVLQPDKFREYVIRHGGGNPQCFMGSAATPVITASVILTAEAGDYEYSLKLRYVPDDDQLATDESHWRFLPTTIPVNEERSPEIGLHPHAEELVTAIMRRVSYDRQVVATQSPVLVDAVIPEDVIFTTASRGAAQFARVPPEVWRRWQEGGCTLSDLWLSRPVGWNCESELS